VRPNRKKLREAKQEAWEQSVKSEAAKRPPRVEIKYVPARPPVAPAETRFDERFGYVDVVELNKRPEHRVIEFPVRPPMSALRISADPRISEALFRTEQFQVTQYGLCVDATQFVWWGYMPVREALKPEVSYGLRRAAAYAERIRWALDGHMVHMYPSEEKHFREWVNTVIEDCEQNLGVP
jgi:hypothetical protein